MADDDRWPGLMATIVEHLAFPVFVKDRAFKFVFVNRALSRMVGIPADEMIGKGDYDFFPEIQADFCRHKDIETFATGKEVLIDEQTITDALGHDHVLTTAKVPLRIQSGEVTHLVGVVHDITVQKLAEGTLRASNEGLQQRVADRTRELADAEQELFRKERLAVLGRLVGGLAHQIRNPLGAIANAAAILTKAIGPSASSEAMQAIAVITEEVWRANRIIIDLIDFARIRPPEPQQVEVAALVNAALGALTCPPRITVRFDVPDALEVSVDRDQVQGAISNLITNAIEAMGSQGTLSLVARRDGERVVIAIEDSGPGIVSEVWDHLFEPLITTKPFGLGLGLTTSRVLIENQGGSVTCSTEHGKGTRFEVWLPLAFS